jgi:hypothetical protein
MATATTIRDRIAYEPCADSHETPHDASGSRRSRPSNSSRLSYTVKSADDELGAVDDAKYLAVQSSGKGAAVASALTLDDFGGRSDALGG